MHASNGAAAAERNVLAAQGEHVPEAPVRTPLKPAKRKRMRHKGDTGHACAFRRGSQHKWRCNNGDNEAHLDCRRIASLKNCMNSMDKRYRRSTPPPEPRSWWDTTCRSARSRTKISPPRTRCKCSRTPCSPRHTCRARRQRRQWPVTALSPIFQILKDEKQNRSEKRRGEGAETGGQGGGRTDTSKRRLKAAPWPR